MGKIASLLEKYNLIEKDELSSSSEENAPLETKQLTEATASEIISETTISSSAPSETANSAVSYEVAQNNLDSNTESIADSTTASTDQEMEPETILEAPAPAYNTLLSISEIYEQLNLSQLAPTDTVFLLENLIKALPEDLPEFVKKTTINNIIKASGINLPKLLEDGHLRLHSLHEFSNSYTNTNTVEINALEAEINRLTAIMADYRQQIKHKETLMVEETNLIHTEQNRIQSILDFFNN